jgi:hypothetical protein
MIAEHKNHISRLLREYSGRVSTEKLINFVADTNGMISACKELVKEVNSNQTLWVWFKRECDSKDLDPRLFLDEIAMITQPFHTDKENNNYHTVLGVEPGASPDRIKQAYRRLSMKYHPDRAEAGKTADNKKFIQISAAYQALQESINATIEKDHGHSSQQWRTAGTHYSSSEQKKWFWVLVMVGVVLAIVVITAVSMNYRKRVMLIGLQQGRGSQSISGLIAAKSTQQKGVESVFSTAEEVKAVASQKEEEVGNRRVEDGTSEVRVAASPSEKVGLSSNIHNEGSKNERSSSANQVSLPAPKAIEEQRKKSVAIFAHSEEAVAQSLKAPLHHQKVQLTSISDEDVKNAKNVVITNAKLPVKNNKPQATQQNTKQVEKTLQTALYPDHKLVEQTVNAVVVQKTISPLSVDSHQYKRAPISPYQQMVKEEISSTVQVADAANVSKEDILQDRIDSFLQDYDAAYEERNIILFSRFFEVDALENGEPFIKMMQVYNDLFESTSSLSLHLSILRRIENDGEFELSGRFKVYLFYKNGQQRTGSGPIKFILREVGDALRIKELDYTFNG